jgi:hypothetical protein
VNSPEVTEREATYVWLDVLILQVKGLEGCIRLEPIETQQINTHMFPHIDANDGVVSYISRLAFSAFGISFGPLTGEQRVLVGGGHDLKFLGGTVVALRGGTPRQHPTVFRSMLHEIRTSQHQPEPWRTAALALKAFLKSSTEPKSFSRADLSLPSES